MKYSYIELDFTRDQLEEICTSGSNDAAVEKWSRHPDFAEALSSLSREDAIRILYEWGAWDDRELSNHSENLKRILWIAAWDLSERAEFADRHEEDMKAESEDFEPYFAGDTREMSFLEGHGYDEQISAILKGGALS